MKDNKKMKITIVAICLMLLVGCGNTTSSESNTTVNNEQNQLTEDNVKETTEIPVGTEVASQAGHVYYWDGWNAFVINYIDSDISPYKVVHIGEIKDKSVCNILTAGADNIHIEVNE